MSQSDPQFIQVSYIEQTSLAQQLNQLRIQQKDEVKLPSRTKLSFLFDIKQAANIDDQTLYYICQTGLRDIANDIPQLGIALSVFTDDILNEKSLEFYRGTQTKDFLKELDDKIDGLIRLLAPYLLHSSTHKVLEFLIRVYEINAYHKETLIFSFLPYFETSFFLRMIQVVNLKQDDYFQFLEQFAFKGQALDKNILIKSLARNDAIVFSKYSQFCFDLADFHQEISASLISVESCLHWKFFGTMLSEVLKSQAGQSQTSLFNLLPFISKAMKSEIKDFKISSYMAISQISCRRSLSTEYASAFFKQVLLSLKDQQNEEYIEKGILVISLIIQYQNIKMIDEKDVNQFLQIFRVQKLIKRMADQQDLSSLLKTIMTSTLVQTTIDLGKVYQLLISGSLNLKLAYLLIENAVSLAMQNDNLLPRCHELLNLIKTHHENDYNQALLFILKQSKESKDKIIRVISGESGNSNLIAQFGEKEYSLLSALGSQHKITKVNALQSVVENINKLTQNEKDLIILQLVTIIQSASDEENITIKVYKIILLLLHFGISIECL